MGNKYGYWGDPDTWKKIQETVDHDNSRGSHTTTAMEIEGVGVVIRISTNQGEALQFVPFATIIDVRDETGTVIGRRIEMINHQENGIFIDADSAEVLPYE